MTAKRKNLIVEWNPSLLNKFEQHLKDGGSVSSFAGIAGISSQRWNIWVAEKDELRIINEGYKKKIRHRKQSFLK